MWKTESSRVARNCAFCQHWYDPTNAAIRPKQGVFWEYDTEATNKCLKKIGITMKAWSSCGQFASKI